MADVLHDLFDPHVSVLALTAARLDGINAAKARTRVVTLLREHALTGSERVLPLGAVLQQLGVVRLHRDLGALCGDESVPALNRAAPAYLLFCHDLDPGVPAEHIPVLAESLLLGCALLGQLSEFGPLLAALCRSGAADVGAIVARLEPWRLPAAAPGHLVYGDLLGDPACAGSHHRVLAVLERDPATDAVVRAAAATGALDDALAARFLAQGPAEPRAATGFAWIGAPCLDCRGRAVDAVIQLEGGFSVALHLHLSTKHGSDAEVQPLLGERYTNYLIDECDLDGAVAAVPLGSVAKTAAAALGKDERDHRALWLLRRLAASEHGMEVGLARGMASDVATATRALRAITGDAAEQDIREAVETVVEAFDAGVYGTRAGDDVDRSAWVELLGGVLAALEGMPIRWDQPVPGVLLAAGSMIVSTVDLAEEEGTLIPEVREVLPPDRVHRLQWREVLAVIADDDEQMEDRFDRVEGVLDVISNHADALEQLGYTMRDVAREVDAPAGAAERLAAMLWIAVDDPIGAALDVTVDDAPLSAEGIAARALSGPHS